MVIFVNNVPVHILEKPQDFAFSAILDVREMNTEVGDLEGAPLLLNADAKYILKCIAKLNERAQPELAGIGFVVKCSEDFKKLVRKELVYVKAAGGVVENQEGKILMMKRLGCWDLPKGKAEKGEKAEITALREVEEECNVNVFVEDKLVTSWHTYTAKGKLTIKRTKWYTMRLISDTKMKPQSEEGIEELLWMNDAEVQQAEKQSYKSISYVLDAYRRKKILK
jgi:ADP-ribose pyrophosphatase YjhB (NUDIX family)